MDTSLGKQFKKYRQSQKINQTKLSKWTGISRSTIWRFENGKGELKSGSLERLLEGMGAKIIIIDKSL